MTFVWMLLALALGIVIGYFSHRALSERRFDALSREKESLELAATDKTNSLQHMMDIILISAENEQEKLSTMMSAMFDESSGLAQNTAANLTDIANHISSSQKHISGLTESMTELGTNAIHGEGIAADLNNTLTEFRETSARLAQIQEQMNTIQDKADAINSVGQDAEMLALNAAIEAARAGEMGRGFAVVADAMKSLAKSSQNMTGEIQDVLVSSNADINNITSSISERSQILVEKAEALVDTYGVLSTSISSVGESVNELDREFSSVIDEVNSETQTTRTNMENMIRQFAVRTSEVTGLQITDLTPAEAKPRLNEFDFLIDVRRPDEYNDELGHIDGTQLITLQTDFPEAVKSLPKDKSYLFICRSGGRSTKAAQQALVHNIRKAYNLEGGMLAWRKAGY